MRSIYITTFAVLCILSCKNTEEEKIVDNLPESKKTTIKTNENQQEKISDSYFIIPGNKLGSIRLNSTIAAVYDSLGTPTSGDAAMQKSLSMWLSRTDVLTIFSANDPNTSDGHIIKLVRSTTPNFKTKDGIGKGSSMAYIKENFKIEKVGSFTENNSDFDLYATQEGISFEFNSENICTGIIIHNLEIQSGITYLPIYEKFVPAIN
ncbi:hypothetical protein [Leeuwenhoekiella sp. NPDC079379]|uniref:hypothetical protein n=1 Tax=Leeuwenhoekiella sp. NPDC079379 TaxID=3364122 RepID=UPI0037CB0D68